MKWLIWLICCWPVAIIAQETKGIRWTEGLSWEEVKAKAKEENKYIFLDCYATWCGPCKWMDKQVYPLDSVGDYFNDKFISVKVQMDVTKNDKEDVITWRKDAEQIRTQYRVEGFPAFLFFSPKGVLVHKFIGAQEPDDFLATARMATTPGRVYVDPHEKYIRLGEDFLKGKIPPDSAFAIHETLRGLGESKMAQEVEGSLYKFLASKPVGSLFTPARLKFMALNTTKSTDRWFPVFSKHRKKVNRVMKDDNYSERLVQGIILNTVVTPFLKMNMTGRMMANPDVVGLEEKKEADWVGLRKELQKQFNAYYIERVMLATRFTWYQLHRNIPAFSTTYLRFLDRYGIDSHDWTSPLMINNFSYNIFFMEVSDKATLRKAIRAMKLVIEKQPFYNNLDTYASLLYKAGDKEKAIQWEKLAFEKARESKSPDTAFFQSVITKMEKGEKLNWQN